MNLVSDWVEWLESGGAVDESLHIDREQLMEKLGSVEHAMPFVEFEGIIRELGFQGPQADAHDLFVAFDLDGSGMLSGGELNFICFVLADALAQGLANDDASLIAVARQAAPMWQLKQSQEKLHRRMRRMKKAIYAIAAASSVHLTDTDDSDGDSS